MSEPNRWYPSKVDWWLAALLVAGPVITLGAAIASFIGSRGNPAGFVALAVLALIYGLLVFPTRYAFSGDVLVVQHGQVRQRILLSDIREVYPTHNPLSSPALSIDRLHVQFGEGFFQSVLISPADREAFLTELAERADLRRDGDRLSRAH